MSLIDRTTTGHTCAGGERISLLHRFALKVDVGNKFVEVGFEQALEPGIDRLIHSESIHDWNTPGGEVPVTADERAEILDRVIEYCHIKGFTYRVV